MTPQEIYETDLGQRMLLIAEECCQSADRSVRDAWTSKKPKGPDAPKAHPDTQRRRAYKNILKKRKSDVVAFLGVNGQSTRFQIMSATGISPKVYANLMGVMVKEGLVLVSGSSTRKKYTVQNVGAQVKKCPNCGA